MRGSVVFLAVFAVTSCSVGVSGAHFVKSGTTGYGTGRGNEDSPGVEESAFGNGENDGHRIGKRSGPGHQLARQPALRSAAARSQQMIDPSAPFLKPILPPQFPITIPSPPIVEVAPLLTPPLSTKPGNSPHLLESHDLPLPLRRAMPSALERGVRPLQTLKFLPLSEVKDKAMKIISNALPNESILPAILAKLSARKFFARSQDFNRSYLKNRRGRYSGLRSYSPLRTYQTLPVPLPEYIARPSYKRVSDTAPVQPMAEENVRRELRSAVIKYLIHIWNKLSKWFEPGSNPGGVTGGLPPAGEIPVGGGKELGPSLPEQPEVHTERPPVEYDEVIIEPVTPPVDDDDVEVIHLSSEDDASETAEDSTETDGSEVDEDYYEEVHPKPQPGTNWEARHSTGMRDGVVHAENGIYNRSRYVPLTSPFQRFHSNWEARRRAGKEDGSEDVASKIEDTSAGTRRKNMRDDLDTVTNIFGRLADDY